MAYQIPTIIEKLTAKAVQANRSLTLDSAKWFQRKLASMPQIYSHKLLREQWHNTHPRSLRGRRNFLGRMFTFVYEPKTKNKLEFYDRFPLVIPISEEGNGFLGLNLHYLSPRMRLYFLHHLTGYMINPRGGYEKEDMFEDYSEVEEDLFPYDKSTRMRVTSWNVLNMGAMARFTRPMVKRYLRPQIRTRLLEFPASEWVIAAFLPTTRFVGENEEKIFEFLKRREVALQAKLKYQGAITRTITRTMRGGI